MKGIGKGAVLNMDHGVQTGREENEGMLQTVKMRQNEQIVSPCQGEEMLLLNIIY